MARAQCPAREHRRGASAMPEVVPQRLALNIEAEDFEELAAVMAQLTAESPKRDTYIAIVRALFSLW